jgi:signal transduction histidine kinase
MSPGSTVAAFAILFAAMALGGAFRYRAGARMRALDQVKLLERERLARDLHDTVAHHVSAIAIRAQAGLRAGAGAVRTRCSVFRPVDDRVLSPSG